MKLDNSFEFNINRFGFANRHENIIRSEVERIFNELYTTSTPNLINIYAQVEIIIKTSIGFDNAFDRVIRLLHDADNETTDSKPKLAVGLIIVSLIDTNFEEIKKYVVLNRNMYIELASSGFNVSSEKVDEIMIDQIKTVGEYEVKVPVASNWDEYYYSVAKAAAAHSKCLSRSIGAVLVKDKTIVSTGYNGPPRGVPTCSDRWLIDPYFKKKLPAIGDLDKIKTQCPRKILGYSSGEGLDICVAGHTERNALINAAREGIATKGTKLYLTCGIPCTPCMVEIINAGVEEIIVTSSATYDLSAKYLVENSNVVVRLYDFILKN